MSETCGRCGRRLKNPKVIEIGYGKVCAAKLGIDKVPDDKTEEKTDQTERSKKA